MNVVFKQQQNANNWVAYKADAPNCGDVVGFIRKDDDGCFRYIEPWRKGVITDRVDTLDEAQLHFINACYEK